MKKTTIKAAVLFVVVIISFLVGRHYQRTPASPSGGVKKILYYHDPMHPAYKSDKPGIAPDCGMQLEPVYEGEQPGGKGQGDNSTPVGSVNITPDKQQLIGVRVEEVQSATGPQQVRLLGRVAADETRLYRIIMVTDGWIRQALPNTVGSMVKKDEVLATFYSPEFLGAEQAFLYSARNPVQVPSGGSSPGQEQTTVAGNIQQYADALRNLGMSQLQIEELKRTRQLTQDIALRSPADGFIIARNVLSGLRVEKGTELYSIADLSHVWILADVYQQDAEYVRRGARARVKLPNRSMVLQATVSDILPQFDPVTRTLKLRLEADNPGYALRPGMFVDVELPTSAPPGVTVPLDALLDSGISKRVFVDRGNGSFEPRMVETGWRHGDRVEIRSGLSPGERVVVSGAFLVDSESRLKTAALGMYAIPARDVVCGMEIDPAKAKALKRTSEYRGTTYHFCSDTCKRQFEAAPEQYGGKKAAPAMPGSVHQAAGKVVATDPVCGMTVNQAEARAAHRVSDHGGKTILFCSDGCKKDFDANPAKYVNKAPPTPAAMKEPDGARP